MSPLLPEDRCLACRHWGTPDEDRARCKKLDRTTNALASCGLFARKDAVVTTAAAAFTRAAR